MKFQRVRPSILSALNGRTYQAVPRACRYADCWNAEPLDVSRRAHKDRWPRKSGRRKGADRPLRRLLPSGRRLRNWSSGATWSSLTSPSTGGSRARNAVVGACEW